MADIVSSARTWQTFGDDGLAEEILGVRAGADVTLAFDLDSELNPDVTLSSPAVTENGSSDLTIDSPVVDGHRIEVQILGFVAETIYTLQLTLTVTDSATSDTLVYTAQSEAY